MLNDAEKGAISEIAWAVSKGHTASRTIGEYLTDLKTRPTDFKYKVLMDNPDIINVAAGIFENQLLKELVDAVKGTDVE